MPNLAGNRVLSVRLMAEAADAVEATATAAGMAPEDAIRLAVTT